MMMIDGSKGVCLVPTTSQQNAGIEVRIENGFKIYVPFTFNFVYRCYALGGGEQHIPTRTSRVRRRERQGPSSILVRWSIRWFIHWSIRPFPRFIRSTY